MIEEVLVEEYASPESGIHTKTSKKKIEFFFILELGAF